MAREKAAANERKEAEVGWVGGGCGEGGDVRFTQAVVEPRLSGRNKRVEGGSGGGGGVGVGVT